MGSNLGLVYCDKRVFFVSRCCNDDHEGDLALRSYCVKYTPAIIVQREAQPSKRTLKRSKIETQNNFCRRTLTFCFIPLLRRSQINPNLLMLYLLHQKERNNRTNHKPIIFVRALQSC